MSSSITEKGTMVFGTMSGAAISIDEKGKIVFGGASPTFAGLTTTGNASIGSALSAGSISTTGYANIGGNASVGGILTAGELQVNGPENVTGSLLVEGDASTNTLTTSWASIGAISTANLTVSSSTTLNGEAHDVLTPAPGYLPTMPTNLSGFPIITFNNTKSAPSGAGVPSGAFYADSSPQSLFLVEMQDMGYPTEFIQFLATNYGLWVEKDIETYGAIMTASDPNKGSGGAAIEMGHGFTSTVDEPKFILSDSVGGGSGAQAAINAVDSNGSITGITRINSGSGYTFADISVGPSGAMLSPVIISGQIRSITVIKGGQNYSNSDRVSIIGNGTLALATLTVNNGVITAVPVTNYGQNYTYAIITVSRDGVGNGARIVPIISSSGNITGFNIYDGGQGYSTSNPVYITNNPHNTLYLTTGTSPANLDLQNITVHGDLMVQGSSNIGNSLSASLPLQIIETGISILQATLSQDGFLSHIDWNTFNNKQNALTFGNLKGTNNQINVTGNIQSQIVGSGDATLSLPQNIDTGASPTFAGLTLGSGSLTWNASQGLNLNSSFLVGSNDVIAEHFKFTANTNAYWVAPARQTTYGKFTSTNIINSINDVGIQNLLISGALYFNPAANNSQYAYLVWTDNATLTLLADKDEGLGSYAYNSQSYNLGAIDVGGVYLNYIQPLNNAIAPNNYMWVGASLYPALSVLGSGTNNTCALGSSAHPWYAGYFVNLYSTATFYDSYGVAPANEFLSTDSNGHTKWVPQTQTWNGGTVTTDIYLNSVNEHLNQGCYIDFRYSNYPMYETIGHHFTDDVLGFSAHGYGSGFAWYTYLGSSYSKIASLDPSGDLTLAGTLTIGSGTIDWLTATQGVVSPTFEVQQPLKFDKCATFADTGWGFAYSGSPLSAQPYLYDTPTTGKTIHVFASCVNPLDHTYPISDPMLHVDQAMLIEKNLECFGAFMTDSDPYKTYGGGAVQIGAGFTAATDPPAIVLTANGRSGVIGGGNTLYLIQAQGYANLLSNALGNMTLGNLTASGIVSATSCINSSPSVSDVTSSRSTGSWYQNTSGKTMFVTIIMQGVASGYLGAQLRLGASTSNFHTVDQLGLAAAASSGNAHTAALRCIVPPNWYYNCIMTQGNVNFWYEWCVT